MRARRAEAEFARACAKAGIPLDGTQLTVEHAEVFTRIAAGGWVGFAEGYLAGEWTTPSSQALVDALVALIETGYRPRTVRIRKSPQLHNGEVPPDLVAHFAGDAMSPFQGHFATGVPTKERVRVKSFTPGAGRGNEPAHHFVDVTEFGTPQAADRGDLADAQARSVEMLFALTGVAAGTHLLELPAAGGAIALLGNERRATVDALTSDERVREAVAERLLLAGVSGGVHTELVDSLTRLSNQRRGTYDAVVSMEKLETLPEGEKVALLEAADRMLAPGGRVGVQTIVRSETYSKTAGHALESLRAYVWPGLEYSSAEGVAKLVDRNTALRVVASSRAPEHLANSLRLQRLTFDAHLRDAAADGYDQVFRRLWVWQFALREALARLGMIDVTQLLLIRRNRRGRR